ncbi:MAG TPA: branched-chain amino acid ABC transporter permease [Stackebrandtia sp.]|uniref:branched-chain amino acid ABC transporter permease n=1 Tax=Stackebrandtia sp. TaxID=2023065 RepID=UPI002D4AC235|nr:branched-chain amino acid ABC transporter permease [Stackebrandtia sp.]HZE39369.1 branched-chain amino acid ABC transporter permease [Stackebrandtia sp.]
MDAYLLNVVNGVAYGLLLFTVAAGLTLALGVADVLNLAHGSLYVVGGYVAWAFTDGGWGGFVLALLVAVAVGALLGAGLSAAVAPLSKRGHLPQALLTFGISLLLIQALVAMFGADDLSPAMPAALDGDVSLMGHRYPGYRLAFIGIAVVLAVAGWMIMSRTRVGARVRAIVDDRDMVACLGTNPRLVMVGVLAASGALAGLAGALGSPIFGPGPTRAHDIMITSLVIVVLGGLGSIPGAFVAALVVGQIEGLGPLIAGDWTSYLVLGAMAVVLVVRGPRRLGLAAAR